MLNRDALRHALRGVYPWFMVLVTGAYITAAVSVGSPIETTVVYALVFAVVAAIAFVVRYKFRVEDTAREARNAQRDAERAEQQAAFQARLDKIEADRVEREERRVRELREDILAGRRCPAWCDSCDEERRESERKTAEWLAERAQQHGHPNAADVEIIDSTERQEVLAMMADQQFPPRV